jgi:hypothetical protein
VPATQKAASSQCLRVLAARAGDGRVEQRAALAGVVGFGLIAASYVLIRVAAGGGGLFL